MRTLVFDVETTGLPQPSLPLDHPRQARILQLACVLLDDKFSERGLYSTLIIPEPHIEIHPAALSVHGLTLEQCTKDGVEIAQAFRVFDAFLQEAECIVGHNVDFERKLFDIECSLLGRFFDLSKSRCTMLEMTDVCRLAKKSGSGWKWPTLEEAHEHCYGTKPDKAHEALADTRTCASIFKWIELQGKVTPL